MKKLATVIVVAGLCGCATALSASGKDVQLMKGDAPAGCTELGDVSGHGSGMGDDALVSAKNDVRNNAAAMGANYVRWETAMEDHDGDRPTGTRIHGTAYKCAATAAAVAPAPAPTN